MKSYPLHLLCTLMHHHDDRTFGCSFKGEDVKCNHMLYTHNMIVSLCSGTHMLDKRGRLAWAMWKFKCYSVSFPSWIPFRALRFHVLCRSNMHACMQVMRWRWWDEPANIIIACRSSYFNWFYLKRNYFFAQFYGRISIAMKTACVPQFLRVKVPMHITW